MVWGAYFLTAHGALSASWLAAGWFGWTRVARLARRAGRSSSRSWRPPTPGFLFAQGLGARSVAGARGGDRSDRAVAAPPARASLLLVAVLMGGRAADAVPLLGMMLAASRRSRTS